MENNRTSSYRILDMLVKDWPLILIMAATVIAGALLYPSLPDLVPSHWNIQGQVDGYVSRSVEAYGIPMGLIGLYLFLVLIPLLDPRGQNYLRFFSAFNWFRWALVIFLEGLYVLTILFAMGYNINISFLVRLGVGVLFIIMSNFLGKVQHNYFIGIRTPWTLSDPWVWRETHRRSAPIWVLAGLVIFLSAFLPGRVAFGVLLSALLGAVLYSTVLSFLLFRHRPTL